jgi:hypothetical protein
MREYKEKVMRKIYTLMALLSVVLYKSQDNSISASVLIPTSYQTGVPDISFPLASLQATKDLTLSYGLTYNPNSYRAGEYCGQVARNWTFSGSNFRIIRKIIGSVDDNGNANSSNDDWDDVYYYNLNDEQGSFKFIRKGSYGSYTYEIKKITPSNIKIDFVRDTSVNWNQPVDSFTITDSKGYKYYFTEYDTIYDHDFYGPYLVRNTFYITKILDSRNNKVATFTNDSSKYYLLQKIETNFGSIEIEPGESGNSGGWWGFGSGRDRYYIKAITLKDHKGSFISKYALDISESSYKLYDIDMFQQLEPVTIKTRVLNSITKLDKQSSVIDKTGFGYDTNYRRYGVEEYAWGGWSYYFDWISGVFGKDDPNFLRYGVLQSIQYPSKGIVEYEFGANKLRFDKNTQSYIDQMKDIVITDPEIQYLKRTDSINFDSKISKKYYLTNLERTPQSRIYIRFDKEEVYPWPDNHPPTFGGPPEPDPKLAYKFFYPGVINPPEIETQFSDKSYVVPNDGSAYVEITGSGGKGQIYISEIFYTDPPYINETVLPDSGVRIEKIKYYDRSSDIYNPFILKKTIDFNYYSFDGSETSSGIVVYDPDDYDGLHDERKYTIYRNLKVTESDKAGYTKYYYKTPHDTEKFSLPELPPNNEVWLNYNYTKKGIIDKKEVFDSNGNKKYSSVFDYTFPPYNIDKLYKSYGSNGSTFYTQESFPEKIKTDETFFDNQGDSLTVTSERTFNQSNYNLMTEKKTSPDGTVLETEYKYAAEKNNTKLLNANMFSIPLEVTQKQNGLEMGKVETFFDHSANYFPSAVKTSGMNGAIVSEEKNDIYDSMGNVLQSSSKAGFPTTYIYGYGGTLLIAKIEGAAYAQVMSAFGLPANPEFYKQLNIYIASDADIYESTIVEDMLRTNLEEFRQKPQFKDYLITTYVYDPLIGVKSTTSPNGNTEYYFYDSAHRLIRVEDMNHNVLKEIKYKSNLNN